MWKKLITHVIFAGIFLVGAGPVSADMHPEDSEITTLKAAAQSVLETHPEIRAVSYDRRARDYEVVQARGAFFPTLDGHAAWGYLKQDKPSLDDDDFSPRQQRVSLRQNIFRGGANLADINRQKSRVRSQAYLVQGTSENLALLTARVYMNVLRSQELLALARENLLNHERIADQVQLRLNSGVDARAEMEQVMGRLALAKSNVVVTEANLNDAITDFKAVVGRMPGDLAEIEPLDVTFPEDISDAEQRALRSHPVIRSAMADLEAREAQLSISKRQLSPRLDVSADYNWEKDVWPYPEQRNYFSTSAVVSMNFFAGGRDYGRIQETLYQRHEAEEILKNAQRETVQSIRLSWEANLAARERIAHLESYVQSAESTAEAFATQWNIGRRTMFDLLDTQAEAINAKADLTRSRYDLMYSEYRILTSMGTLVHSLGLDWPEEGRIEGKEDEAKFAVVVPDEETDGTGEADQDEAIMDEEESGQDDEEIIS
jgi:outer membrane protein, adhesin transport system